MHPRPFRFSQLFAEFVVIFDGLLVIFALLRVSGLDVEPLGPALSPPGRQRTAAQIFQPNSPLTFQSERATFKVERFISINH